MAHRARIQQLLTPLQESIVDKPPFVSGTIPLQDSNFELYYKDGEFARFGALTSQSQKSLLTFDGPRFRRINLANPTPDKLEIFIRFTSPSSFGIKQEKLLDETYCKAGEMDRKCFSPRLS